MIPGGAWARFVIQHAAAWARLPNPTGDPHARRPDGGERIRASARRPSTFSVFPAKAGNVAAPQDGPAPTKPAALFRAATDLLPVLEAGQALDAATLRRAMSTAFGATDAQGAWIWKDAYEAAEAALVLFLQRYARLMRHEAGAGPDGPAAMLAMLETLAALEASQTRRSEEQTRTPAVLDAAAARLRGVAGRCRPAGRYRARTLGRHRDAGRHGAMCAPGPDRRRLAPERTCRRARRASYARLFPDAPVTRHNAEAIADRLSAIAPSVVLMNPPFSVSPGVNRMRHDADLRHLRSAFSMLPVGGRLAAITSANCIPGDAAWADAFERLDASRGVLDRHRRTRLCAARHHLRHPPHRIGQRRQGPRAESQSTRQTRVTDAAELLAAVAGQVPPRLPVEVAALPTADLFGHRPAPRPTTAKHGSKASAKLEPQSVPRGRVGVPSPSFHTRSSPPTRTNEADAIAAGEPVKLDTGPYDPWAPRTVRIEGAMRASDSAGAIRRHGGGLSSRAGLPPDTARTHRGGRPAFRCPARKCDPHRSGPPQPARCPSTASRTTGRPSSVRMTGTTTIAMM